MTAIKTPPEASKWFSTQNTGNFLFEVENVISQHSFDHWVETVVLITAIHQIFSSVKIDSAEAIQQRREIIKSMSIRTGKSTVLKRWEAPPEEP